MTELQSDSLTLAGLVRIFLRIGTLAFGGGGSTLAMLYQEFCVRREVVTDPEFQVLFGLSRVVPGMNLLALTVLLGYRTHGIAGALLSLAGLTVPSFAIIVLSCVFLRAYSADPFLRAAVHGLAVGAAALLLYTAGQLCRGALLASAPRRRGLWLLMAGVTAALALRTSFHPAWIIVGGGALGVLLSRGGGEEAP
jgi:chromate transporter